MKKMIITLTTGRSGTNKLQTILSSVSDVYAEHEAKPCYRNVLLKNSDNSEVGKEFVRNKLAYIESLPCEYYCDTTFLIAEGFIEHFLSFNIIPDVIILRRNPRDVASSMYQLGTIPGRPDNWIEDGRMLDFWLNPYYLTPGRGFVPYRDWEHAHDYQLCYWFCVEMAERTKYYSTLLRDKGAKVVEITTPELSNIDVVNKMLVGLGLPQLDHLSPDKVNARDEFKNQVLPTNLEELELEVWSCVNHE